MTSTPTYPHPRADETRPRRFVFVLLGDFTLMSFASAIEALRLANRMSGKTLYTWHIVGEAFEDAGEVSCSAGTRFRLEGGLDELSHEDTLLICGGVDVQKQAGKKLIGWLRREARRGVRIGGLCTASWVLAKAGLLDGRRATIHWENQDSFEEDFPEVELTKSVFVTDGNRLSTAGGTASIDLMLSLIASQHGPDRRSVSRPGSACAIPS